MESSRQEYWSGLPFPPLGDLPDPGIEPRSPALQVDSLPFEPPGDSNTMTAPTRLMCVLMCTSHIAAVSLRCGFIDHCRPRDTHLAWWTNGWRKQAWLKRTPLVAGRTGLSTQVSGLPSSALITRPDGLKETTGRSQAAGPLLLPVREK